MESARPRAEPVTTARLTEVTARMIRERGVEAVTMRGVADELGVRAASLYHHIADKDALMDLVLAAVGEQFGSTFNAAFRSVATLDQYLDCERRVSMSLWDYYLEHPGVAGLVLDRMLAAKPRPGPIAAAVAAEVEALVRLGVPVPDATRIHETCVRWALAMLAAETAHPQPTHTPDRRLFADGLDLLLDGVRRFVARSTATTPDQLTEPATCM